jgi:hypothetical protein
MKTHKKLNRKSTLPLSLFLFAILLFNLPAHSTEKNPSADTAATNGSISGFCFYDENENGIMDEGEPPVERMTVSLAKLNLFFFPKELETAVTDKQGTYTFSNLSVGIYSVTAQSSADAQCGTKNSVVTFIWLVNKTRNINFGYIGGGEITTTTIFQPSTTTTLPPSTTTTSSVIIETCNVPNDINHFTETIGGFEYIVYARPNSQVRLACQTPCPMSDDFLKKLYTGAENGINKMISITGLNVPDGLTPVYLHYTSDNVCGDLKDFPLGTGFGTVDSQGRATLCMFDYEKDNLCIPFEEAYLCVDCGNILTEHEVGHFLINFDDYKTEEGFIDVITEYTQVALNCGYNFSCDPGISACHEWNNFTNGIYPLSYYLCRLYGIDVDSYKGFFQSIGNANALSNQELKNALDAFYGVDTTEAFIKAGIIL